MNRKRDAFCWFLVLILLISLTGCGLREKLPGATSDQAAEATEKQNQTEEKKTIEKKTSVEENSSAVENSSEEKISAEEKNTLEEENTISPIDSEEALGAEEKPKALIVDNETGSSKRMRKYLTKAGFDVTMVDSMDFEVEDYDTLVIPGGHNITPSIYGAERDEHTYGTDEEIDKLQIAAVKAFAEKKKPILGVCRGCQLVNVAFGGTINQHIPGWHKKNRRVKIERGSWLYYRLGTSESVYHYHHQCVEELGEGLVATMWDKKDGHIEGFEHESLPVYGIQWHPDSMGNRGIDVFRYYKEDILGMETVKENDKKD